MSAVYGPSLARTRAHGSQFWRQHRRSAAARRRPEAVSIGDHLRLVRRYRRLLAASLLAGLLAGLVAVAAKPKVWVSGAQVYANPIAMDPAKPATDAVRPKLAVSIDTEAAILLSHDVLTRAVARTSLTAADLEREIQLTAAPNSRVLKIQVADSDPARAKLLVRQLTTAYLAARRALLTQRQAQQVAGVQRSISALVQQQAALEASTGSYRGKVDVRDTITAQLTTLRGQLGDLQAQDIDSGQVLRAPSDPRGSSRQAQVRLVSWTLLGLALGGLVVAVRERRPAAARTPADIHHLPIAGDLPIALLDHGGAVDDGMGGWVSIADAIGPEPAATLIVPIGPATLGSAVAELTLSVERRGWPALSMAGPSHTSPAPDGAAAIMQQVRASGRHLVGAGPPLAVLDQSLSVTQADSVVLLMAPGTVNESELDAAIDRVVRLGIPVLGVILDREHARPEPRFAQLTRAAT